MSRSGNNGDLITILRERWLPILLFVAFGVLAIYGLVATSG